MPVTRYGSGPTAAQPGRYGNGAMSPCSEKRGPGVPAQVLVATANRKRRRLLVTVLRAHAFLVHDDAVGGALLEAVAASRPDLVVLDLPDAGAGYGPGPEAGLALLRDLREQTAVPVIVLATAATAPDVVSALLAGADDYLTWPVHLGELVSRMRAVLRRVAWNRCARGRRLVAAEGQVVIDLARRAVWVRGRPVALSPMEWRVLATLAEDAGRVLPHDALLTRALGLSWRGDVPWLRVLLSRLRRKLGSAEGVPPVVSTHWGIGYVLVADPDAAEPWPSPHAYEPSTTVRTTSRTARS